MTRRSSGAWPQFFRSLRPAKTPPPPKPEQTPEQDAPEREENQHE